MNSTLSRFLPYYIAVGLFTAGETFAVMVIEKKDVRWYDWACVAMLPLLWLPLLVYILLYDKYNR